MITYNSKSILNRSQSLLGLGKKGKFNELLVNEERAKRFFHF